VYEGRSEEIYGKLTQHKVHSVG